MAPRKKRGPHPDDCRDELRSLVKRDQELRKARAKLVADRKRAIERAKSADIGFSEIARLLGRDRSGLWRELQDKKAA